MNLAKHVSFCFNWQWAYTNCYELESDKSQVHIWFLAVAVEPKNGNSEIEFTLFKRTTCQL